MTSRLLRAVEWDDTDDAELPWRAQVDDEVWQVRLNKFPGSTHLFALIVNGEVAEQFQQWPDTWKKPVDEYQKREAELEAERAEYHRNLGPSKLVK